MTTEPRTRTPKPHPYIVNINLPDGPAEVLIEAHSVAEARAWFVQNFIDLRKAEPRELHAAGMSGAPFFSAIDPDFFADAPEGLFQDAPHDPDAAALPPEGDDLP